MTNNTWRPKIRFEGRHLPGERLMIFQWQEMPELFLSACWSVPDKTRPGGLALVFTSFCLN